MTVIVLAPAEFPQARFDLVRGQFLVVRAQRPPLDFLLLIISDTNHIRSHDRSSKWGSSGTMAGKAASGNDFLNFGGDDIARCKRVIEDETFSR